MAIQLQTASKTLGGRAYSPFPSGLLQRKCAACGNHTVAGGVCEECKRNKPFGLQTKLTINEPGDRYEQEADRIADEVMAMPSRSPVSRSPLNIQRFSGAEASQTGETPESVHRVLASPGRPLEPPLRQDMETRFGYDFSQVRVHTDSAADQSADDVNAQAYTVGHDIVFGTGRFTPETDLGRRLLTHELTHVVQQTTGLQTMIQRADVEESGCDGKVGDIFKLYATNSGGPPEAKFALIGRKNQGEGNSKTYHIGDYLNDYMEIVDIPTPRENTNPTVLVMHCENLETLYIQAPEPEHTIKVKCGTFGNGTVKTFNNCQQVEFIAEDSSKPSREYILESEIYWLQDGTRTGYPPSDLEGYMGVHLQGNMCGMLKECQGSEEEGNKSQKGYEGIVPSTLEEFKKPEDVYGRAIQKENTKSGGSMTQYQDGTIEYYNQENKLQVTYRLYNGKYYTYANKAIFGGALEKSALEGEIGVSIH